MLKKEKILVITKYASKKHLNNTTSCFQYLILLFYNCCSFFTVYIYISSINNIEKYINTSSYLLTT